MLSDYIKVSLKRAEYKKLEDGSWYSDIPGFAGVWANENSVEECRDELQEVKKNNPVIREIPPKRFGKVYRNAIMANVTRLQKKDLKRLVK